MARSIAEWLDVRFESFKSNGQVELAVKAFFRWLDRNVEEIFTSGLKQYQKELMAKAAGLQFVSADELKKEYNPESDSEEEDAVDAESEGDESGDDQAEDDEDGTTEDEDWSDEETQNEPAGVGVSPDVIQRGTEVKLFNLQLRNSIATLLAIKVQIIVQCERCKHQTDIDTPTNRTNSVTCGRCAAAMLVTFRPNMLHEFTAVLGYVDVEGCSVFDLILPECDFSVSCLACSKAMLLKGISVGQPKETWCHHCNAKMRVVTDAVRFLRLQPSLPMESTKVHKVEGKGPRRVAKDPAIQEGKALPENGTCKHYKKSYRWMRFPCCGKAYPCDVCHDEREDHEMKYANRMICGYCCKEQPYAAEKPCVGCDSSLIKKSTTHWEGGKGCRDKIKMSRDDDRKYSNTNKTVSRKAQAAKKPGAKKTTKLRHT